MKRSALKKLSSYKATGLQTPSASGLAASKLVKIGEAAKLLGISIDTLRRWEKRGWLRVTKTPGGTRLYDKEQLSKLNPNLRKGPKSLLTPLAPIQPQPTLSGSDSYVLHEEKQSETRIHLNSDEPILKISEYIKPHQIQSDIVKSFSQIEKSISSHTPSLRLSSKSWESIKNNIQFVVITLVVMLPLLLLAGYLNSRVSSITAFSQKLSPFSNNTLLSSANLLKELAGIFSPTLSHALYGNYPAGSPPGFFAKLNNKSQDQLASGRVSGEIKGKSLSRSTGSVLADSTPSGSFLQINLDTQINGSLSVDTATVSGALYSATINTGFGDNEVYPMNQPLLTTSPVTFATLTAGSLSGGTLSLTSPSNQLTLANTIISTQTGGSGAFTVSIPALTSNGNFVIDNAVQTLTNKTISGSSNTFESIPNSALSSSSITINAGSGLSGGGEVSLGGSITLTATGGSSSGVSSITGTTDQVIASASTGDIILSLPQSIATTSSPEFANLTLSDLDANGVVFTTGAGLLDTVTTVSTGECLLSNGAGAPTWGSCFSGSTSFTLAGDSGPNQSISSGDTLTINGDSNIATLGVDTDHFSITLASALTGITSIDTIAVSSTALTFAGAGTISSTTSSAITIDSGTTGTVNLGTGNNAKTINLGTGTAGNTINIATDNTVADTLNIASALDTTIISGAVRIAGLTTNGPLYISGGNGTLNSEAQLAVSRGGTGQDFSSTAQGSLPYFSATGTFSALAPSTAGYVLTTQGAGANPTWTDAGSLTLRWNTIDDPNGNQTLAMADYTTTWNWATADTETAFSATANALTSGTLFNLSSTSTAGDNSKLLNLSRSGTNGTSSKTNYGLYSTITNTGTSSTNIAGYFSASGADTNYAINAPGGYTYFGGGVGIGSDSPTQASKLSVVSTGSTTSLSVTNLNTSTTAYGVSITKSGAATTGVGLYVTSSGATNNYAAIFDAGNVGIGTSSPTSPLEISSTLTADNSRALRVTGTFSSAQSLESGATILANATHTTGTMTELRGIRASAQYSGTSASSPAITTFLSGMFENIISGASPTGTITNGYGIAIPGINNTATGSPSITVTNQKGLQVSNQANGTGSNGLTITSAAGLVLENTTGAINNTNLLIGTTTIPSGTFSIYNSSTAANYFAGNVGIGDTSPDAKLDVEGTISGTNGTLVLINPTADASGAVNNFGVWITPTWTGDSGTGQGFIGLRSDLTLNSTGETLSYRRGLQVTNPTVTAGTLTTNYGLFIDAQTAGTSDYGIYIADADTANLWLASNDGDAASGIAFGSSRDTNLYRSAADTLKTDDAFNVNGNLNITSAGAISAATGITSSGTITFSGLSADSGVYTTTGGQLTTTPPSSGTLGYWSRTGSTLSPANSGDAITTSGNISTTGSGTISSAGLLSGTAGLTITGATASLNASSNFNTNINTGTSTGAISIGNSSAGAIALSTGSTFGVTTTTGSQTFTSANVTGTTTSSSYVFNSSSLTSGTALYVSSTATSGKTVDINASQTSGTVFNLAYGSAKTLSGDLTGLSVDLNSGNVDATNQNITGVNFKIPTVTDTHTSGTKTLTGMLVNFGSGAGINQNGAGGTLEYVAGDFYMPALTQSAGTLNAYGTRVTTPATITTGGTAYGNYISATGVGAGTLSGLGVSSITGGAGTEYALNIGSGWDAVLRVGSTTVINGSGVTVEAGGGTGQSTYTTGDILYASGANTLAKRAIGNNNEVLTVVGGVPTWASVSGATCSNCIITDPTSDQTIAPTGQGTTGLIVRQTSTASPTDDIFQITSSDGATKYFYVDKDGNVSTSSTSGQTLTLTPLTDTTALTLVGTNVTSQPLQYVNSNNESATSGIINMAYGSAQTLTGSVIGIRTDLSTNVTATNQSVTGYQITLPGATNTSGTQAYKGLVISGGSINENGGTATTFTGADITIPALTQTSGTLTAYGANITTPSSITTAGTAYGVNIAATGVGAGSLYGVNVSDISAGAGTEVGMQIGSGWDTNLLFNDTTTRVAVADGGTITILDTAGNSLCTITDNGSVGDLECTGSIGGSGTVGFWSRDAGTGIVSPSNANDVVAISSNKTSTPLLNLTSTGATSNAFTLTGNSITTGNLASLTGTGFTTGEILDITGTWAPTDGSNNEAIDINITHSPTSSADTFKGIELSVVDNSSLSNLFYGGIFSATSSVSGAKTLYGLQGGFGSSSTTADILNSVFAYGSATGAISTGTRQIRGFTTSGLASTAASTGGTLNMYGGYFNPSSTGSNPGTSDTATNNVYGIYTAPTLTLASDCTTNCTSNQYGVYVDNGTSSTNGTSTKYGIYINTQSGADTNYALYSAASANSYFAGNLGIGTTPSGAYRAQVSRSITSSDNSYDGNLSASASVSSVTDGYTYVGFNNYLATSHSSNAATLRGIDAKTYFSSQMASEATVGVNSAYAIYAEKGITGSSPTGTISNAFGLYSAFYNSATGTPAVTVSNNYGLYITNQGTPSGSPSGISVGNAIGLYVAAQSGATSTNYAAVFAGGNVGIGDTSPASALTVGSGDLFQVNSSGAIAAATGITSSGTINFSGLSASSGVYTDGSKNLTSTPPSSGTIGYWSRTGTTLSTANAGDNVTVDGTLDANGQFDIGDGGDAGTISATTLDIDATGALQINSSGGAISIGNDAVAQAINIGTGAAARTITLGNATGATALAFNSGTGSQTFTSQVVSGTTTTSGFVFDATALTTGTGSYFTSDSITQGKLLQVATTGNTLTSGTLADIRTTSTALTGSTGTGSLLNLDWSPGSSTTATGDLFSLNIGSNGSTTGKLFNILDSASSIFSVSETSFTTSLPTSFTSAGDVSIAYDLQFTNPTASYIKSYSGLTIQPGDPFGSSNLTLSPYNEGSVYIPSNVATAYGLDVDANLLSSGRAVNISSTSTAGTASGASYLLYLSRSGANSNATHTAYGIYSAVSNTGTTNTDVAGYFSASGAITNYAIQTGAITSAASGTNYQLNLGAITGASSATSASINTGAISGAGTSSSGITLGANSSTATTNYGINIGALSGAGTTNYGINIAGVSGASTNYAIYVGSGNVNIQDLTASSAVYTDSNKNLTSTAPSSGTIGYWSRTGTTLSPATAGDVVLLDNNTAYQIKDSGGTARSLVSLNSSDMQTFGTGGYNATYNGYRVDITSALPLGQGADSAFDIKSSADLGSSDELVQFGDSAGDFLTILGGGNVGIGDSSPAALFTVGSSDAFQINSSGNIANIGGAAHTIANSAGALGIDSATTGAINIGTSANAKTITLGNNTGATALAFTSGTGSQTFTSSVATTSTTSSAFVFTANSLTSGTGAYINSTSLTTGKLFQLSTGAANTLTSGTLADFRTTSTALTGSTGTGSLLNLDWSPGSSTTATGDLFALNIGSNGTTTGKLFNILDSASSIFSVSETSFTTSLPSNFTAAGDTSIAYDINFTNPTASYIKSVAPLYMVAGETFNSSNLNLQTYNFGSVVVDSALTTGTGTKYNFQSTLSDATANANVLYGVYSTVNNSSNTSSGTHSIYGGYFSATSKTTGTTTAIGVYGTASGGDSNYPFYSGVAFPTANTAGLCWDNSGESAIYDCNGTPTDLAENYGTSDSSIEAGDVVAFTGEAQEVLDPREGKVTTKAFVKKSNSQYQNDLIGIVSTNPNQTYGEDGLFSPAENPRPVSLTGRIPVKVSTENGPIAAGDYLTSSSIPGVAMKSTQPGVTIGRALNGYNGNGVGKVIVYVKTGFADPNEALANLLIGNNGQLLGSELNLQKITVATSGTFGGLVSANNFALDSDLINKSGALASIPVSADNKVNLADTVNALNSEINTLDSRLSSLDSNQASQSAQLAEARTLGEQAVNHAQSLDEKVASTSANLSSLSSRIDELLASLSGETSESTDSGDLNLTPPSELIATDSATFANLDITENLSTLNIEAMDATISSTFKSLGETFLGQTTIAGDLSVDGTMSFTNGNSINAFPTLFFQNNPLASAVDFFNGKITLDKDGLFSAEAIALGDESLGDAVIYAGQTEVTIPTSLIKSDSKVFLTPTSPISGNIYVGQVVEGSGFKVKISQPNLNPVEFNWMIVQTKETAGF